MRSVAGGAMLLGVVTTVACSGSSDTTAPRLSAPATASFIQSGVQQRVTGNMTILLPTFNNALERYSVSAIRHADGRVTGELEETSEQEGGQRIHGNIVCFTIVGNTARLAARLEQSNVPFGPVGTYVVWTVIDNGQGAHDPPDLTTDLFFGRSEALATTHCNVGYNLAPFYPSLRGNLQVGP